MHYLLEIVMPPTDDIQGAVDKILEPFSQYDGRENCFYDWYVLGGRFSGAKAQARIDKDVLENFYRWLKEEKVTVSGVICGKQMLKPDDQIEKVDAKWKEMTGRDEPCSLFSHAGDECDGDVCTVGELPEGYKASHVIIASDENFAVYMVQDKLWNGVSWQDATWNGCVRAAIYKWIEEGAKLYEEEYQLKITPTDDWLVVTVDYHS